MNCYYGFPQMNTMTNSFEEVVCPKPRRYPSITRPFRCPISYQSEIEDSEVGSELLDIIHPKGSCYPERSASAADKLLASSPPYFIGSPPSRASNPVIQDERFGNGNFSSPFTVASPSPSARGCGVPMKFGNTPVAVRIEGFDCLRRDRRSISAVA